MQPLGQIGGQPNQNMLAVDPELRRVWMSQQQMGRQQMDGINPATNVNAMMDLLRNNHHLQQSQQQGQQIISHQQQPQQGQLQHHPSIQSMNSLNVQQQPNMNMSQQNSLQNIPSATPPSQMTPQQIEQYMRANPASGNQPPFLLPQQPQSQQLQRRMAISHDNNSDISRQFQLLNEGHGIRPHQNRGPMMSHQQPGQPQQRSSLIGAQMAGIPIQNPAANMVPQQQTHPFASPNLTANVAPQRGPSPQMPFQATQLPQSLSYEQVVMKMNQTKEEIKAAEVEINMLTRSRPQQPDQLPGAHNKLQKKKQHLSALAHLKSQIEAAQYRQNGGPSSQPQSGMPWNGSNPNPQFTGTPTPVNTADLQAQLAMLNQHRTQQGLPILRPSQQQPPQNFPFLPPQNVANPTPQQQGNDSNSIQHSTQLQNQDYLLHMRQQQQQQQHNAPNPQANLQQLQSQSQQQQNQPQPQSQAQPNPWLPQQPQQPQHQQPNLANPNRINNAAEMMQRLRIPPMERAKFESALKTFYERSSMSAIIVDQPMRIENATFLLWDLHRELFTMGTFIVVNAHNLWSVVGAKLGFPIVQQQPARCSDKNAEIIKEVHKMYLIAFEQAYLQAVGKSFGGGAMNAARAMSMTAAQRPGFNGQSENNGQNPGVQPNILNNPQLQQQILQSLSQQERMAIMQAGGPNIIQHIFQYANFSIEQMKERGVPEPIIACVERSRQLVNRNILKVPEDAQKGVQQQQPPQPPPRVPTAQASPAIANQRSTPMMPNQPPAVPNGHPPADFSQPQLPRPNSIGMQRMNAPSGMILPETVNQQNSMPLPTHLPFRPSKEELQNAMSLITNMRQQLLSEDRFENPPAANIPEAEIVEWRREFDIAVRQANDLEKHFAVIVTLYREQKLTQQLVNSTTMILKQLKTVQQSPPLYIIGLQNLKGLNIFFQQTMLRVRDGLARVQRGERPQQMPDPDTLAHGIPQPSQQPQMTQPASVLSPPHVPMPQTQPPPPHLTMPAPDLPRAPSVAGRAPTPQGPPISKVGRAPSASLTRPSGAANTPSPATAPTPAATPAATANSPPKTPKSPGKKGSAKPRAPPKKKGANATPTPAHLPTPKSIASPAPSPQSIPTSVQVAGVKRSRPDDTPVEDPRHEPIAKSEPTPPQKKVKLEPPPEVPPEVEEPLPPSPIRPEEEHQTAEQVIAELDSIFSMAGDNIPLEFQQVCNGIAESFSLGNGDSFNPSFPSTSINSTIPPPETQTNGVDLFEIFDYIQYEEDGTANANTPDLVPASGTGSNCSPESVPDSDAAVLTARSSIVEKQKATENSLTNDSDLSGDVKSDSVDPMFAILSELEMPNYLQGELWSWDKTMPPAEWAIL